MLRLTVPLTLTTTSSPNLYSSLVCLPKSNHLVLQKTLKVVSSGMSFILIKPSHLYTTAGRQKPLYRLFLEKNPLESFVFMILDMIFNLHKFNRSIVQLLTATSSHCRSSANIDFFYVFEFYRLLFE